MAYLCSGKNKLINNKRKSEKDYFLDNSLGYFNVHSDESPGTRNINHVNYPDRSRPGK